MSPPGTSPAFEEAIKVTPLEKGRYSANLRHEWCIGTVPHGGYTAAVLYRLALTHFAHAHPTFYPVPATPISMQLTFLRRTGVGPATLDVQDMKLGARTSTIHITLSQPSEKKKETGTDGNLEVKVAGYITISPSTAEVGVSSPSDWDVYPSPPPGSGPSGRVNLENLGKASRDGEWVRQYAPFPEFRRAATQLELFGPEQSKAKAGLVDQWARFQPGGDSNARWSNDALAFLADMFPMALDGFDSMASAAEQQPKMAKYWYPTVTMNIDFKKRLEAPGPEWLYSRIQTKSVRNGRTDLDVTILDEKGEVVALSTQVGLVLSATRNVGTRTNRL